MTFVDQGGGHYVLQPVDAPKVKKAGKEGEHKYEVRLELAPDGGPVQRKWVGQRVDQPVKKAEAKVELDKKAFAVDPAGNLIEIELKVEGHELKPEVRVLREQVRYREAPPSDSKTTTERKKGSWTVRQAGSKLIVTSPDGKTREVEIERFMNSKDD